MRRAPTGEVVIQEGDEKRNAKVVDTLHVAAGGMAICPDVKKALEAL